MKGQLLIGFVCLLFSSALFALEENREKHAKYTEVLPKSNAEKISTVSFPYNSSVVIPEHLIGLGDQNNSDHQKKFKALLDKVSIDYKKDHCFSFVLAEKRKSTSFQTLRFILFRNLRL